MSDLTATTALPYPHLERATTGLRGALRQQLLAAGVVAAPDWSALRAVAKSSYTRLSCLDAPVERLPPRAVRGRGVDRLTVTSL
jgi:hypothetical protein